MTQTAWVLSLSQFYLSLGFMLFFLALELGLAWVLLGFRLRAQRAAAARLAYRFWVRIFALSLILEFGSGFPLLLQLGTLWPRLMDTAGEVVGPLVALVVLTTFIFKSCFLGAMLYGQRTLSNRAHTLVVAMVALGTSLTAYWLVALLAWMQWPVGATLGDGHYAITSWRALLGGAAPALFGVLFFAGLELAATLMLAVTAVRTRARPSDAGDRHVYATGLWLLFAAVLLQALLAAQLGRELLPIQPGRLAAVIPQWDSGPPEPLALFALPGVDEPEDAWAFIDRSAPAWLPRVTQPQVRGLRDLGDMAPPVWPTLISARVAVALALLLALASLWALWRGWRRHFEPDQLTPAGRLGLRATLWVAIASQFSGWGHLLVGSLPYAVYGAITLREVGTLQSDDALWGGLALNTAICAALVLGFHRLLRHTARFGVVPVARHRGRA